MIARGLFAAAALLATAAALAADPPEQAASEAATASPASSGNTVAGTDTEKKICRTEKVTGSLSRRNRICLTEAQWREVHDRTRRGVDEMTSAASGGKECILDEWGGCR